MTINLFQKNSNYLSWGRVTKPDQKVYVPGWRTEVISSLSHLEDSSSLLTFGKGRSYGDLCLNPNGHLIDMSGLDNVLNFDDSLGILHCESGLTIGDIIKIAIPRGFFIPVSPGTKFVTIGGAIASDVHGKNHHVAGTLGSHIEEIELLRSTGEIIVCHPNQNQDLFNATIGGMGLTGIILSAKIKLMKAKPYFDTENIRFENLDEFIEINADSEPRFDYTVAWVDCTASGKQLGRGIYMRGNHSVLEKPNPEPKQKISIPIDFPNWALNNTTVKLFNELYFRKQFQKHSYQSQGYDAFFYPLDSISNWNKIYGKRGFYQYQFVIPKDSKEVLKTVFQLISKSGLASFLAVLKTFGDKVSPGLMSFPSPGFTLALDFCNKGKKTDQLFEQLDELIMKEGGRLYPAKDSHMSQKFFETAYPNLSEFKKHLDPKISSGFWRRTNG